MEQQGDFGGQRESRGPSLGSVVMLAIIFGMLAGFGGTLLALWANQQGLLARIPGMTPPAAQQQAGTTPAPIIPPVQPAASGSDMTNSFAQVVDTLNESVVNINTTATQPNPYSFFGGEQQVQGMGTGMIVDDQGHILTNYHVVGEADQIDVTVMHRDGKKTYKAKLIGGDRREDLAVIKIEAKELKPVQFGNSDGVRPGEWVMAIGNPFGFEHTVSVGVVSALNRGLNVDETTRMRGMIQTDATINPGNSGGPLLNARGEVIGINTMIFLGRGGSGGPQASGLGFAIPSNRAVKVMEILRKHGKVQHPYIGIVYRFIDERLRVEERLPVKGGVLIMNVMPNSPAAKAGLKAKDIIASIDGKKIEDENTLSDYINTQNVGTEMTLEVKSWDENSGQWKTRQAKLKTAEMPEQMPEAQPQQQRRQQQPQEGFPFPFPF
jgi:S1-C subfamily serine protease